MNDKDKASVTTKSKLKLSLALEQRIVFDAAGADTFVEATSDAAEAEATESSNSQEQNEDHGSSSVDQLFEGKAVAVIDKNVENFQTIAKELGSSVDKIFIDSDESGMQKLTEQLDKYDGEVQEIHIISYGQDGKLFLGNDVLDSDALETFQNDVESWSDSFTENANMYIYGSDVAESETGQEFVQQLSEMTNTDVAASTDSTGAEYLDGDHDFVLEHQVGQVEHTDVYDTITTANYNFTLDVQTNDSFADAELITFDANGEAEIEGSNTGTLVSDGIGSETDHKRDVDNTVWYKAEAQTDGFMTFDKSGGDLKTTVQVFSSDNTEASASEVEFVAEDRTNTTFEVEAGKTYWFAVDGVKSHTGDFSFDISFDTQATNDAFANAEQVTFDSEGNATVEGHNINADQSDGIGAKVKGDIHVDNTVWYQIQSDTNQVIHVDTVDRDFAMSMQVFEGDSSDASSDDVSKVAQGGSKGLSFEAEAGKSYWIAIDGHKDQMGMFEFDISTDSTEITNDAFADAEQLTFDEHGDATLSGHNVGADQSDGIGFDGKEKHDQTVWYSFTAQDNQLADLSIIDSNFNSKAQIFVSADASASPDSVGLVTESSGNKDTQFETEAGKTYWIAIDGGGKSTGTFDFELSLLDPADNDAFDNAESISFDADGQAQLDGHHFGATISDGIGFGGKDAAQHDQSVWYSFTAQSDGHVELSDADSDFTNKIFVFEADSSEASTDEVDQIAKGNVFERDHIERSLDFEAEAGKTYFISVDAASKHIGEFNFDIQFTEHGDSSEHFNLNSEAPAEQPTEEVVEQTIEQPAEEVIEQTIEQPADEIVEQTVDQPADEIVEQTVEQPNDEIVEQTVEQPNDEIVEQTIEQPAEEIVEQTVEQPNDEIVEQTVEQPTEEIVEQTVEQPTEEIVEQTVEPDTLSLDTIEASEIVIEPSSEILESTDFENIVTVENDFESSTTSSAEITMEFSIFETQSQADLQTLIEEKQSQENSFEVSLLDFTITTDTSEQPIEVSQSNDIFVFQMPEKEEIEVNLDLEEDKNYAQLSAENFDFNELEQSVDHQLKIAENSLENGDKTVLSKTPFEFLDVDENLTLDVSENEPVFQFYDTIDEKLNSEKTVSSNLLDLYKYS